MYLCICIFVSVNLYRKCCSTQNESCASVSCSILCVIVGHSRSGETKVETIKSESKSETNIQTINSESESKKTFFGNLDNVTSLGQFALLDNFT